MNHHVLEPSETKPPIAETIVPSSAPTKQYVTIRLNRNHIISGVLSILVIVTALQTVQLVKLRALVVSNAVTAASQPPAASPATPTGGVQSGIPDMVGGC